MKARVKATGALLEVRLRDIDTGHPYICDMQGECGTLWKESELEFLDDDPDYWTRLEHQYAGMAMQGLMTILPNIGGLEGRTPKDEIVDISTETAHALIQKLKEKEEMK
jgi:hypothetical protein